MKRKSLLMIGLSMMLGLTACGGESKVKPRETKGEPATLEQGIEAVEESDYERAIVILTDVIEQEPDIPEPYVYRGDAYMYAGHEMRTEPKHKEKVQTYYDNAKEDYDQAVELDYEDSDYIDQQNETLNQYIEEFSRNSYVPEDLAEAEANGAIDMMEYAMVISSMQQMGCWNVCWDFLDADGDNRQEMYMTAFAENSERQHQFIADASGPYFKAHVATGAAGSSEFLTIAGYDSYILQDGYYTAGNTSVVYYEWNGSQWEEVSPATGAADYAVFSNPDPVSAWMNVGFDQATSVLHEKLTGRENFMSDFHTDFDGDGIEEYVYFYQGAANRWFGRLKSDNNFGTEPYLGFRDYTWTAIVVSWDEERGQTCLRIGNFGEYSSYDVMIDGNIMTFNGEDFAYQKEGIPFLYQGMYEPYSPEPVSGSDIDLGIATFYVPDSWNGRVTMINDGTSVSIYEINDYALGGGGYIRTIGFSTEYDTGHPARTLYASMDVNGTTYYLYMEQPTDVPYIDFANIEAGMAIANEIDMQFLMDHIGPHQDYVLDWFIG